VEFFSKRFTKTEQRYSTNEREALALVLAVLHFKYVLIGIPFKVYTDHVALTSWLKNKPVNERHAKWLTKIQDLVFDIEYVPGGENVFADLMSRPGEIEKSSRDELQQELEAHREKKRAQIRAKGSDSETDIEPKQVNAVDDIQSRRRRMRRTRLRHVADTDDPEDTDDEPTGRFKKLVPGSTWYERIVDAQKDQELLHACGISGARMQVFDDIYYADGDQWKVILPEPLREEVIREVHNLGHYGKKRTRNTTAKMYTWKGLTRDVNNFVRTCPQCQKNKASRPLFREYL